MTRNMKDKMWIVSDKKLLTTDQNAKGMADGLTGHCVEEVPRFIYIDLTSRVVCRLRACLKRVAHDAL